MKYKVVMIIFIVALFLFGSGITYSIFNSNATMSSNQNIAAFIFNSEQTDHLEVPLVDLKPGTEEKYNFSVTNTNGTKTSNVVIEYKMIVKTIHLMPLTINIYKSDDLNNAILTCDESNTRDSNEDIVCNSTIETLNLTASTNNYVMKVTFPSTYNNEKYSNLVDYIDLEISSWQKTDNQAVSE